MSCARVAFIFASPVRLRQINKGDPVLRIDLAGLKADVATTEVTEGDDERWRANIPSDIRPRRGLMTFRCLKISQWA